MNRKIMLRILFILIPFLYTVYAVADDQDARPAPGVRKELVKE